MYQLEMKSELKPFQKETLKWMTKRESKENCGMLLSDAGTGKTIVSLNIIVNNPVKTLIILKIFNLKILLMLI